MIERWKDMSRFGCARHFRACFLLPPAFTLDIQGPQANTRSAQQSDPQAYQLLASAMAPASQPQATTQDAAAERNQRYSMPLDDSVDRSVKQ